MAGSSPLRVGRYELHHELGSGGMASVFLATLRGQAGFRRLVAVKRMHPHLARDPQFVEMFTDEARLTARLRHPNIVAVTDVVDSAGELLLVMEYVSGISLAGLLDGARENQEPLPWAVSVRVLCDALEGLHAAHDARDERGHALSLVHRDVSPHNLLVGADGTTRLLDFGIAQATGKLHRTSTGIVRGKASYMAPEQIEGRTVDRRADVYAAGITLWEALVGRRAFSAGSESAIAVQVLHAELPSPHEAAPAVPSALSAVVMQAVARDPESRFDSARAFAEALENAVPPAPPRAVARVVHALCGDAMKRSEAAARALAPRGEPPTTSENAEGRQLGAAALREDSERSGVSNTVKHPVRHTGTGRLLGAGLLLLAALGLGFFLGRGRSTKPLPAASAPVAPPEPTSKLSPRPQPSSQPLLGNPKPSAPPASAPSAIAPPETAPPAKSKRRTPAPPSATSAPPPPPKTPLDDLLGQH